MRRALFVGWVLVLGVSAACSDYGSAEERDAGARDERRDAGGTADVDVPDALDGEADDTIETGPSTKVVRIVARTSACAFNPDVSVCAGSSDSHTCALRNDRTIFCWGSDRWGRLGFVASDEAHARKGKPSFAPRRVEPLLGKRVKGLTAGADHTCAVLEDGEVHCWGYNWNGQLGISAGAEVAADGSAGKGQPPARASIFSPAGAALVAESVEAGQGVTCARDASGAVSCVGKANDDETRAFDGLAFAQLAIGWKTACGRTAAGALYCSGDNAWQQIQAGGALIAPQTLVVPSGVLDVAVGNTHVCATVGAVSSCWGEATPIGSDAGIISAESPQPIGPTGGGAPVTRIAAGANHTCWVHLGQVTCAGDTFGTGALVSSSTGPLADVRDVAASRTHTCAVTAAGSVYCWGGNTYGEIGRDPAVIASSNEALLVTIPD